MPPGRPSKEQKQDAMRRAMLQKQRARQPAGEGKARWQHDYDTLQVIGRGRPHAQGRGTQ